MADAAQPGRNAGSPVLPEASSRSMRAAARARRIAQACGILGAGASLSVLAGWWFDVPAMRRLIPGQPPMVVLTALGTLLLGTALLFAARREGARASRRAGRGLAGAAAAVALGGGLQYALPGSFRLDDWVQRLVFAPLAPGSGMALTTAVGLVGAASGLILQDAQSRRLRRLGTAAALLAFVVASVGGLGYAYGLGAFHQVGPYSRMALLTALTLGTLSLGVLLSRPNRPWVATALGGGEAGALTRHMLPATVVAPLVLGLLELHAVRAGLLEAETGTALLVIVLALWLAALTPGWPATLSGAP